MQDPELMKTAMSAAKDAWDRLIPEFVQKRHEFDEQAFDGALRAYMVVLANSAAPKPLNETQRKAVETKPTERSPAEHFLALCSGHYHGYTMTSGMLPDNVLRKMICYQPDANSSILYPLFISLMHSEMEAVVDHQGRPFLIAITGGEPLTVVK